MSRIMNRYQRHEERARDLAKIADIILTTGGEDDTVEAGGYEQPGEKMVLRCIPVITRGVGSVIPDTNPLNALIAKEAKLERQGRRLIPRRRPTTLLP